MTALHIVLLVLAALIVAFLTWLIIQFKTFERGVHHDMVFQVDRVDVKVKIHYAVAGKPPMILRWLKTYGFAMLGHIWIWYPLETVPRVLVAHELVHRVLQHIIGGPRYLLTALGQWATQWVHNRRGMEEEATRAAPVLAATGNTEITVHGHLHQVSAPWLMDIPTHD